MLVELGLGYEPHVRRTSELIFEKKKVKARAVVGRVDESLLIDLEYELSLRREKEKEVRR